MSCEGFAIVGAKAPFTSSVTKGHGNYGGKGAVHELGIASEALVCSPPVCHAPTVVAMGYQGCHNHANGLLARPYYSQHLLGGV